MNREQVVCSDCLEHMRTMPENSVDSIVTDPPYGLEFMGAGWDAPWKSDDHVGKTWNSGMSEVAMADGYKRLKRPSFENTQNVRCRKCGKWKLSSNPCTCAEPDFPNIKLSNMRTFQQYMTPIFAEALRVAKPGAHLLCFGGTRTFHRMACAIEDAGWEIRDCIMWTYGSGFPKSMDVAKAIDKSTGYVGEVIGERTVDVGMQGGHMHAGRKSQQQQQQVRSLSDQAKEWDGWGTCLKPAWEPIIVARKPLDGTVAHNVLTWGVGALNIDGCRVPTGDKLGGGMRAGGAEGVWDRPFMHDEQMQAAFVERKKAHIAKGETLGRFPANLVHDGSQMVLDLFPDTNPSRRGKPRSGRSGVGWGMTHTGSEYDDSGSAARFFYCAKASKKDRNYGCERLLTWAERDQELTQLLEQASSLLARDISESMMLNLVEQGCSTSLLGNESTVLSQEECRFITSTVIPLITASKTCSSSPRSNTSESILDAIRTSEESGISLARLADKSSQSRQDSTSGGTDTATSAVSALFGVLSEIRGRARVGNFHCTVKPTELMKWLVKLVTPEGGVVLDPFAGSGTTLVACKELGRSCIGIEREPEYVEIIKRRLETT